MGIIAADEPTHAEKSSLVDLGRESVAKSRRRLPEGLSPEDREKVAAMDTQTYRRWLNNRRKREQRAREKASSTSLPGDGPEWEWIYQERLTRPAALTAWVVAHKGVNRFARSLVAAEDQAAVFRAWDARTLLMALGDRPTLEDVAVVMGDEAGPPISKQQAGRLLDKVAKLEAPGGPWSPEA
jgi:hypothetical protein